MLARGIIRDSLHYLHHLVVMLKINVNMIFFKNFLHIFCRSKAIRKTVQVMRKLSRTSSTATTPVKDDPVKKSPGMYYHKVEVSIGDMNTILKTYVRLTFELSFTNLMSGIKKSVSIGNLKPPKLWK